LVLLVFRADLWSLSLVPYPFPPISQLGSSSSPFAMWPVIIARLGQLHTIKHTSIDSCGAELGMQLAKPCIAIVSFVFIDQVGLLSTDSIPGLLPSAECAAGGSRPSSNVTTAKSCFRIQEGTIIA